MILKHNPSINIAARIIEYNHFFSQQQLYGISLSEFYPNGGVVGGPFQFSRQFVDSAELAFGKKHRTNQNRVNAKPHVTPEAAGAVIPTR